jgi:hypothetical protein
MTWLKPVTLTGQYATLKPLSLAYHDDLITAVQDGELWKLWYTNVPEPSAMRAEIERRLDLQAKGSMLPFVICENAGC